LTNISLPTIKGKEWNWSLCRIDLLMQYFVRESDFIKHLFTMAVRKHGQVLTLITYCDEVTPGDAFAPDNLRKAWCIYVSVREFGIEFLCREESWLPLAIARTSEVAKIDGGMPCVFKYLLRSWFIGPLKLSCEGVCLNLEQPTIVTFAETLWIKDLDAYRAVFGWKGSSSLKPCLKCRNTMKKGHASVTATSWQIDITCTDFAKFDLATDEDVYAIVDLIASAHADPLITMEDVKTLAKAHGYNHIENGQLGDR
jgi:hypothetical protein